MNHTEGNVPVVLLTLRTRNSDRFTLPKSGKSSFAIHYLEQKKGGGDGQRSFIFMLGWWMDLFINM